MEHFFLIGMKSTHSNSKEDRKFQFFYAKTNMLEIGDCHMPTDWQNSLDGELKIPNAFQSLNWGEFIWKQRFFNTKGSGKHDFLLFLLR